MKKFALTLILMVALSFSARSEELVSIISSTSFGECSGYCTTRIEIAGTSVIYTEYSNLPNQAAKTIKRTYPEAKWDKMRKQPSLSAFFSLPDTIGTPDGVDQGAETLEIKTDKRVKILNVEYGADIPKVRDIFKAIRDIRLEMRKRLEG